MVSIQKSISSFKRRVKQRYYLQRYLKSSPGSVEWLIGTELKYGGKVSGVKRNRVSPFDPRTKEQLAVGGCTGGDRMLDHAYASSYSSYLHSYIQQIDSRPTICEFGILKGTGLAVWCDLFPSSRCIGFDIDLSHIEQNMENLVKLGAFSANSPEIYEYDQYVYSPQRTASPHTRKEHICSKSAEELRIGGENLVKCSERAGTKTEYTLVTQVPNYSLACSALEVAH